MDKLYDLKDKLCEELENLARKPDMGPGDLGTGILQRNSEAASLRHVDDCFHVDVEKVTHGGWSNDCGSAVERFTGDCERDGDRPGSPPSSDGNISVSAYPIAGAALVCDAPQGNDAASVPVADVASAASDGRFCQKNILTCRYSLGRICCKFRHVISPSVNVLT